MKIPVSNAEILFNDDILSSIKEILTNAKPAETVYLVTPYIRLDTRIREAIEEALEHKVELVILMRAGPDHSNEDLHWLLKNRVILRKVEALHAKVYVSLTAAIIASMNLHTFSVRESKEAGLRFTDPRAIEMLRMQIEKWKSQSTEVDIDQIATKPDTIDRKSPRTSAEKPAAFDVKSQSASSPKDKGFCIRCGKPKSFGPKYPLCDDCYKEWAKYKNDQYAEKVCHRCGKPHATSFALPLCKPCYKELNA